MKRSTWQGLSFVLPATALYLPLIAFPLGYSLLLSLHRWNGLAPDWTWVGATNYLHMVNDSIFWLALVHNLALVAVSLLIQLPIALLLALLIRRLARGTGIIRTGLFAPYILPTVVIAIVWRMLIEQAMPSLLGSTTWSLPLIMLVISWRFIGFHMVLYLAGLAAIDPQLDEAARLDGATPTQILQHITLPMLKPVLLVSITLAIIGSLKYFDIIYVMTEGGPAHATELLATYMYKQAFSAWRLGYGSALAVTLTLLATLSTLLVAILTRKRRTTA